MPITGTFEADFSAFHRETKRAQESLDQFAVQTVDVGTAFTKLGTTGSNALTGFHQGLSQADKTLASMGIHLGPQIQAVRELGEASGKTASQIGMIGTAGLVVGAALGGWKVGRMIADFYDLDEAISTTTSSIMGWGNVAAETAGAKMDTINMAIRRGADATISYTDAIKFNTEWAKRMGDANEAAAKQVAAAIKAMGDAQRATLTELGKLQDVFTGENAIAKAEQYIVTLQNMEAQGLRPMKSTWADIVTVATAAKTVLEETGRTGNQTYRDLLALIAQYRDRSKEALLESRNLQFGLHEAIQLTVDEGTQGMLQLAQANATAAKDSAAYWEQYFREQQQIIEETDRAIAASAQQTAQVQAQAAQQAITSWSQAMQAVQAGRGTMTGTVQQGGPFKATREQIQRSFETGRYYGPVTQSGQINWAKLGYGGTTVNVNASNSFYDDPSSVQRLADKVGNAVMASMRAKGWNA